eukprot:TRINITY_DN15090_c0_g1::TRINITY_DN15090_c0_g1_i1::g.24924::m.24924 TRINITY_DN15090_c0_g1::TRINITY_DN15090_c0_g1_i1::g.24924  ORF type:complete len:634 (+),score=118.85,sp/P50429/ARSB_MOUSE/31.09/2e-72,Sulfatase/PF00884.18/6.3e-58,Sulfatase_C/PF14707.1/0.00057,Phosphodiest/PF01663.17/43,Phosphodiest/PF01663.17/0.029,DUF1501/PF07394.7/0.084 TRINITY_DN15090_c0_g1_i1:46-1947(+)
MARFNILFVLAFILYSFQTTEASKRPHIVIAVVDDMGFADMGYQSTNKSNAAYTPVLDDLAHKGVRLQNFYTHPICSPARTALMTGRYALRVGMGSVPITLSSRYGMPLDEVTLADRFKASGYSTNLVGKWHLGASRWEYTPLYRGFDSFYGILAGAGHHFRHIHGDRGGKVRDLWRAEGPVSRDIPANGTVYRLQGDETGYSSDIYAREAVGVIRRYAQATPADAQDDSPLLLVLTFQAPHGPKMAPQEYIDMNAHVVDDARRLHCAMVTSIDVAMKKIVQELKDNGMWDNTAMVFFSDNGGPTHEGAVNFPFKGTKNTLWEGGVHVPAFLSGGIVERSPMGSKAYPGLVHVSDVMPTLVAGAAALPLVTPPSRPLDGINLWHNILYGQGQDRDEVILDMTSHTPVHWLKRLTIFCMINPTFYRRGAMRRGDLKLIVGSPGPIHDDGDITPNKSIYLFNVTADPSESVNLASRPEYTQLIRNMSQVLREYEYEMYEAGRWPLLSDALGPNTYLVDALYVMFYNMINGEFAGWCGDKCLYPREFNWLTSTSHINHDALPASDAKWNPHFHGASSVDSSSDSPANLITHDHHHQDSDLSSCGSSVESSHHASCGDRSGSSCSGEHSQQACLQDE